MYVLEKELGKLLSRRDAIDFCREVNDPLFITSFLEDEYLYHTTPWSRMKRILRDGFLTSNAHYLKRRRVRVLHEGMICFTTSKWRHLSNLPEFSVLFGFIHMDTYLRIPYDVLKRYGVKPVIYKVSLSDLEGIVASGHYYYLATLTHREDRLREMYGEDFEDYLYRTWWVENEWRIKADRFDLPECTEVYVSSYHQRKVARQLTDLPVKIDHELMRLKQRVSIPDRIRRKMRRIVGKELYNSAKCVEVGKRGELIVVRFWDIPRKEGARLIEKLEKSELKPKVLSWYSNLPYVSVIVELPPTQFKFAYQVK